MYIFLLIQSYAISPEMSNNCESVIKNSQQYSQLLSFANLHEQIHKTL